MNEAGNPQTRMRNAGFREKDKNTDDCCLFCDYYQMDNGSPVCHFLGIKFGDNFSGEDYICRNYNSSVFDNLVDGIKKEMDEKEKTQEKSKEGCYIATAVYGDYDAPEVMVLRKFRDDILKKSLAGRLFIKIYYALSPKMAEKLKNHMFINKKVKMILDQIVLNLKEKFD
ncbi:hypothetical protein DW894_04500 [Ruminococcus sp. AM41-10BH]|nr:hypothetical protein DW894_04500 [Ruminococcus sp. AM41-10BH]